MYVTSTWLGIDAVREGRKHVERVVRGTWFCTNRLALLEGGSISSMLSPFLNSIYILNITLESISLCAPPGNPNINILYRLTNF